MSKENKENEMRNSNLVDEINQLKEKLNDKLKKEELDKSDDNIQVFKSQSDEFHQLKNELELKNNEIQDYENEIKELNLSLNEYKIQINLKDNQIDKIQLEMNSDFNAKLTEINLKLLKALKQVEIDETENAKLKREIEAKSKQEQELRDKLEKQSGQHENFSFQLNEKISEIEFLNRENNSLLERANVDEKRLNIANSELENYKNKVLNLNSQLDLKINEIMKFENIFKNKDTEIACLNLKMNVKEIDLKHRTDECEMLQLKYQNISSDLDSKVNELIVEIERLKSDKEKLSADLYELRAKHSLNHTHHQELNNDTNKTITSSPISSQTTSAAIHTNNLKNIELLATKTKFETKINVYELEISNLKAKIGKLLKVSKIFFVC